MGLLPRPGASQHGLIVSVVHILSPLSLIAYFIISSVLSLFRSRNGPEKHKPESVALRRATFTITASVASLYAIESILLICTTSGRTGTTDSTVAFSLFSTLAWIILILGNVDAGGRSTSFPFYGSWLIAFFCEAILLLSQILTGRPNNSSKAAYLVLQLVQIVLLSLLLAIPSCRNIPHRKEQTEDEEVAPLLVSTAHEHHEPQEAHLGGRDYGAAVANGDVDGTVARNGSQKADDKKQDRQEDDDRNADGDEDDEDQGDDDCYHLGNLKKDWWVYAKAFRIFLPYMWPSDSIRLQLHFPALGLCLIANRVLNPLAPLQLGRIVDKLGKTGLDGRVPWTDIAVYILIRFLDSGAGIVLLQSWLWLPIDKNASERLQRAAYAQMMNLSSDFHDSKRSGSTWETIHRGSSISGLIHVISFEILPMAADLVIAISVFWWLFDAYMAFIVACSVVFFLWSTSKTISSKTERQRKYIKAWEDEYQQMTESSLNWTTVSYFNKIEYEKDRYAKAVRNTQQSLIRYQLLSYGITALRSFILQSGLLAACCLAATQIVYGKLSVGDFVILLTYWAQLSAPLSYFASGFTRIAQHLVDAEKLLALLQKVPTVHNRKDAKEFVLREGAVEFEKVSFSYDGKRKVTDGVTFRGEPGQTVALVGETGGGKSTILKLLFRFYDVTSGRVMIDGQDIREFTLESLRKDIGVVPQDPALFNQTILENLRYARLDASEEEIQEACRAVSLHDKIMSFTKGYAEKVGERGVKLSGGELQRMAIARALLKDPKILLLDEATSSVDSETEAQIQASLKTLCAGRTTFIIAHRLSTIIHANQVIVISDGRIVEQGSHDKLIKAKGHYHRLWTKQLKLQSGEKIAQSQSRSRSRSPAKSSAILVNDVGLSESMESLSKPALAGATAHASDESKTKPLEGRESAARADAGDSKGRGRSRSPAKAMVGSVRQRILSQSPSPSRIPRSGSPTRRKLNVDAPEFVPMSLQRTPSTASSPGDILKPIQSAPTVLTGSEISKAGMLFQTREQKSNDGSGKHSGPRNDLGSTETGEEDSPSGVAKNDASDEEKREESTYQAKTEGITRAIKSIFSSRRGISKSAPDPDHHAGREQIDGTEDSQSGPSIDGQEEGATPAQHRRIFSAPVPTGDVAARKSGDGDADMATKVAGVVPPVNSPAEGLGKDRGGHGLGRR